MDVKPGSDLNILSSSSPIPVAILSTDEFDATTVDPATLSLDGISVEDDNGSLRCSERDVNHHGLVDLVCTFNPETGDATVVLEGETFDGFRIREEDMVHIVR